MKAQEITLSAREITESIFKFDQSRKGKAIVSCCANPFIDFGLGVNTGCGLLSTLAEVSLTVAGNTVLGNCVLKDMEIEMLSEQQWDKLTAVASILDTDGALVTARCEITTIGNSKRKIQVARAFATLGRAKTPLERISS